MIRRPFGPSSVVCVHMPPRGERKRAQARAGACAHAPVHTGARCLRVRTHGWALEHASSCAHARPCTNGNRRHAQADARASIRAHIVAAPSLAHAKSSLGHNYIGHPPFLVRPIYAITIYHIVSAPSPARPKTSLRARRLPRYSRHWRCTTDAAESMRESSSSSETLYSAGPGVSAERSKEPAAMRGR